jgi:hypothetical protein
MEKNSNEVNGHYNSSKNEENPSEDTVSLQQLVQKQIDLEEEAQAQLEEDWGDEDRCTFDDGYITQPVYACETCALKNGNQEKVSTKVLIF